MPKKFIRKTFDNWLKQNRANFKYQPVVKKSRKNHIKMGFNGISPRILCSIGSYSADVYVVYKGDCWDSVAGFDIITSQSSEGYYCELCEPGKREIFASREELWMRHCFDFMLEWVNENFNENRWAYLYGSATSMTWVELKGKDEKIRDAEYFVDAFPVVEKNEREIKNAIQTKKTGGKLFRKT